MPPVPPLPPLPRQLRPPHDSCSRAHGTLLHVPFSLCACPSIPAAPCSYSPNLSRRCTHLAVPAGGGSAAASDKLRAAVRNQRKWGLRIVDLRWVLECAQSGRRLDEASFLPELPPADALLVAGQEQAAPGSSASKGGSVLAADSYQPLQGLPAATVAAAAARAQRTGAPPSRLRHAAPSLQTQAPSVKHSVHWQAPQGSRGSVQAAPNAAAAAVLPEQLERRAQLQDAGEAPRWAMSLHPAARPPPPGVYPPVTVQADVSVPPNIYIPPFVYAEEAEVDYCYQLPMTQAGFLPAAYLLEQLRACTAGLPLAPPTATSPELQQQQQGQQHASPSAAYGQPLMAQQGRQDGAPLAAHQASPGVPLPLIQTHVAVSTAELLDQLRLSSTGAPLPAQQAPPPEQQQQQQRGGLSTAELLEQLRAGAEPAGEQRPAGWSLQQQRHTQGPSTDELLVQLRSAAAPDTAAVLAGPAAQPKASTEVEQQQAAGGTEDLAALLQQLQQHPPAGRSPPAVAVGVPDIPRPQQPHSAATMASVATPASRPASALPHVQAETAAATASQLAAQMRSLLQESPALLTAATGEPAQAAVTGRSTEELLAMLRQQAPLRAAQPAQGTSAPAAGTAAGSGGSVASAAAADGGNSSAELLAKLQSLGPQQEFTPLRQQQQMGGLQLAAAASEEPELPPAKYCRQEQPGADAAPVPTPAAAAPATGSSDASLGSTAIMSGGMPASSADSPSANRGLAAPTRAALPSAAADALSPAGSGSDERAALASQVAESGGAVFAGMVALVDPDLSAEEQQR